MAEGPVVHHYAKMLQRALEGKQAEVVFTSAELKPHSPTFQGTTVSRVEAHGKQIRIYFANERIILVHLLMWGSWRIYRRGAAWDKPPQRARLVIRTSGHEAVAFSAPVVKVFTRETLQDSEWAALGPDPLRPDFSLPECKNRLTWEPEREIGEVLLDQRVIAGIGNILRIEILFSSHIHPRRKAGNLGDAETEEIIHWTVRLMQEWLRTISRKQPWMRIYRRSGHPCPVCGTRIEYFRQAGRITYACPHCQT